VPVDSKRKAELRSKQRAEGRDIGTPPPPANPKRRKRCERDLLRFATTYFPQRFPLAFSEDHKRALALLQVTVLKGGQHALAMPRGSGKTTMIEVAALWAILNGHRRFVFVIGADAGAAEAIYSAMRSELDGNDLLAEDFPDSIHAIRALDGIARRAEGQTSNGERTCLLWTKVEVRLPRSAPGGGSIVRTAGITGRIRGAKAPLADGTQTRPDLILVDDFQTDESARSPSQVEARLKTLTSTVLGLAGPGQQIAVLAAVTVIEKGDGADQLLDRKAHPEWRGYIARLMRSMPSGERARKLWDEYGEILREAMRVEDDMEVAMEPATAFYREHRAEMDVGADPSWLERKGERELSATQHAMNLLITRGNAAFSAEYQNEPIDPHASSEIQQLSAPAILRKLNQHDRGVVPIEDSLLTAAIDVGQKVLHWVACGWTPGFSGDLFAYGTYPDQGRPYFTNNEIEKTMEKAHPGGSWKAALFASLELLVEKVCGQEWQREDGTVGRVEQCVIDAGYGDSTDTVYEFCRRSKYSAILLPYFGRTIAAGAVPIEEYKRKPGDRIGYGWRIGKPTMRQTRHVIADANKWKSFLADRLLTPVADGGSLSINGRTPSEHRMLADQLSSEIRTRVHANGRTSDEWRKLPNRENHFLDAASMAALAASIRGLKLDDQAVVRRPRMLTAAEVAAGMKPAPAPAPSAPPRQPPKRGPRGGWMGGFGFGGGV
jgi:hypothetical protein